MNSAAFHFSPKIHHAFGLLLMETMSPRTFKISHLVTLLANARKRESQRKVEMEHRDICMVVAIVESTISMIQNETNVANIVTRLGDLLDFRQLFQAFVNN